MKAFNYYADWAIEHLKKQLEPEDVQKSIYASICEVGEIIEKGKAANIGEIRTWNGKKYKKISEKKWIRYYDSHSRGSQQALRSAIREIENLKDGDVQGLMQIILKNKSRFSDDYGKPLPKVLELSKIADSMQEKWIAPKVANDSDGRFEFTQELKTQALNAINNPTEKINYVDYTRENYNKLFPRGECKTPIGIIKLSPKQFERFATKDNGERIHFMGALKQCLESPDVIIGKTDNKGRYSKLFLKAFIDNAGKKSYMAIVPTIDGVEVVVSNSPRDTKDIAKEIKKTGSCYYIRPASTSSTVSGGSRMENPNVGLTSSDSRKEEVESTPDNQNIQHNNSSVNENDVKLDNEYFDAARKTLAPITYDDNGDIIPLSQRFNKDFDDIRKSFKIGVKKSFADNFMNNLSIPSLQKSIFVRGQFDDYKISDDELKEKAGEGHFFDKKELSERGANVLKVYEQICEDTGLNMAEVVNRFGVSEDGFYYDLQNPTENFYYTLKKNLEKSLTWSGHKLQDRTSWNGLNISIENKKGSVRRGVDKDGHKWATKMHFDYGYIRGTEGTDGDHVDCCLGDNMDAKKVYIVHQNDPVTHKYDEDKCMLGFDTLEDAKRAYLMQYDRPGFLGKIDTMDFEDFKTFVLLKRNHGKKIIKSYTDFVKSIGESFNFGTMRKVGIG